MASSSLQQLAPALIARSKTLINHDLRNILKGEGMTSSGIKAALQAKVIELIDRAVKNNDHVMFNRLQYRVANNGEASTPQQATTFVAQPPPQPAAPLNGHQMSSGYSQAHAGYQQPTQTARLLSHFKESPFFEMRELVLRDVNIDISPNHRHSVTKNFHLSDVLCTRLKSDPTLRLMLFSAIEQPLAAYTRAEITFPSQIEVRVNNDEVRANFKGLKNKPGSTRPADITDLVRLAPAMYKNNLHITYALTQKESQKKFNMFIYMVRKFSVEDLAKRIGQRNVITKQSVLSEMKKKASDPDIVVESSVMSLKDPISTLKMTTPCRSTICTHDRCFDAESFLQLQEQAPMWQCPICNKTISFEALAVDEYVQEILEKVPRGTDQVTIEPDGRWSSDSGIPTSGNNAYDDDDSDSDEEPINHHNRVGAIKSESIATPLSMARTPLASPSMASREASSVPRTGSKRGSEVIDLTLSDDDEPVRPRKKVAYSTPNSLPDRQYQMPFYGGRSNLSTPHIPAHSSHNTIPLSGSARMEPPAPHHQHRHSYGSAYPTQPQPPPPPRQSYPGQGSPSSSSYPTYIGSSP